MTGKRAAVGRGIVGGYSARRSGRRHLSETFASAQEPRCPEASDAGDAAFPEHEQRSAQEHFSDGLTEETITDLGQLRPEQLGVIARTSAMAYRHTNKTVSQIGQELSVAYILEGSVRREGGEARVSAQLIRVSDQTHLWAPNYERELHDLLLIENELGKAIARQVQINLTPQQEIDLSKMRTVNPEAYDLYLKGRFY